VRIAYIAVKGIPHCGGIERVTEEIGSRLAARGHDITVYSSRDYGTDRDMQYKGMTIRTVPSLNTKSLHKLSICYRATWDVIKRVDTDIVHFHAVGPSVFSIFPRLRGIPTVVQTHGIEWRRDKWGIPGKTFLRLCDYTVPYFPTKATAVSVVQKDYYESRFGREVVYIPNGVTPVENRAPEWILKQPLLPDGYVLFAARLAEEKGAHLLINAFRRLKTDMNLVIAGDADHNDRYKAKLRSLAGDDPRILFTGFVTGTPLEELFSNAYLFCLPSTLEGLPLALLEAMNFGNCCLASDIPESREALGSHGYTFKNRDEESLYGCLEDLLSHPEKVAEKKQAAQRHVRQTYSWERVTDQMEALYLSLLQAPGFPKSQPATRDKRR
jgi:glycosyltransferase involved in cell wall biosynthesis